MIRVGYEKDIGEFHWYIDLLTKQNLLNSSVRVADIGAASGKFLNLLHRKGIGSKLCAYDLDNTLDIDSEARKSIVFKYVDMNESTADLSGKFDLITMFDSIEHFRNYDSLNNVVNQNLNVGGILFITTPNANSLLRFLNKNMFTGEIDPTHVNLFTQYTLDFMLRRMGLTRVFKYGLYNNSILKSMYKLNLPFAGKVISCYTK